jgi:hypothetical protein
VFLAADCSRFITGRVLLLDGGMRLGDLAVLHTQVLNGLRIRPGLSRGCRSARCSGAIGLSGGRPHSAFDSRPSISRAHNA